MEDKTTQPNSEAAMPLSNILHLVQHTITNAASTTSSSQTETNIFLPTTLTESPQKLKNTGERHINANVVRIQLGSQGNDSKIEKVAGVNMPVKSSFSEGSSSIPSSYEKTCNQTIAINSPATDSKTDCKHKVALTTKELDDDHLNDDMPPLKKPIAIQIPPSFSPNHNRGRRGGIIPNQSDNDKLAILNRPRIPILTIPPPPVGPPNYHSRGLNMEQFSPHWMTTLEELEIKSSIPPSDGSINAQLQSMPDSIIRISISTPSS